MLQNVSLREKVYQYLRRQIQTGELSPGSFIKLNRLAEELGISTPPLKEAIVKLESEGFVEIFPYRGVLVKELTKEEVRDYYEIIGSLESTVVLSVFDRFTSEHVDEMKKLNRFQEEALQAGEFDRYYQLNLDFHEVFLRLSSNVTLRRYIMPLKQRLYDFPRRQYWKEWERVNLDEHSKFIHCIERRDREGAVRVIRDEHWGWKVHEPYFVRFYELNGGAYGAGVEKNVTKSRKADL